MVFRWTIFPELLHNEHAIALTIGDPINFTLFEKKNRSLSQNIDFSIERLQSGEVKNNVTIRDAVDTIIIEEEHLETSKKSRQRHKKKEEDEEEIPKKNSTIRKRK